MAKIYFYIKIIVSGCVIGTPVNFGGMTVRALAVILKLNCWKSCDHKKSFITSERVRILTGHPVCFNISSDPRSSQKSTESCTERHCLNDERNL
jgi:hypothetical protein